MAEKNLILKLKLEVDSSSGEKITKLIKSQGENLSALVIENEKLKQAELSRTQAVQAAEKARLSLLNANGITIKSLNVDLINQIQRQKQLATELQVKIDKANIDIEKQGKGWGLIAGRMAAVVAQYNSIEKVSNAAIQARVMDKLLLESDLQKRLITQREQFNALIKARPLTQLAAIETTLNKEIELNNKLTQALLEQAKARTSNSLGSLGLSSAAKPTENRGYVANAAGTVAENRAAKLDAEIKEAKRLYDIRVAAFNTSMAQQETRMRQSVDIEVATRTSGINSIQTIRARAAQQEFQLEERYQAQLAAIRRSVASGATPISAGNAAMTAATTAHTQALAANRIQLNHQETALNTAATAHQNLFLRVGEAIGAYRIWNTAINVITTSMRAIPKIGIEMESTIASLTATTGSAAGMASVMVALEKEANRTGITIGTLRETFRGFQASTSLAGETMQSTWHMFTNLNTVITGLHLPSEKASGIFLAMAQIFNKTKVQSEELVKQLGNLLPGAFASFAAANNIAFGGQFKNSIDLINQMKKGMVFAHETVEKFTQFMADRFAPAFALASQGLNSNIGRMQTSFTLLGESIYKTSSGAMLEFVKAATKVSDAIREDINGANKLGLIIDSVINGALAALSAALVMAIIKMEAFSVAFLATPAGRVAALIAGLVAIGLEIKTFIDRSEEGERKITSFLDSMKTKAEEVSNTTLEMKVDLDPMVVAGKEALKIAKKNKADIEYELQNLNWFDKNLTNAYIDNLNRLDKANKEIVKIDTALIQANNDATIKVNLETGQALADLSVFTDKLHLAFLRSSGRLGEAAAESFEQTYGEGIAKVKNQIDLLSKEEENLKKKALETSPTVANMTEVNIAKDKLVLLDNLRKTYNESTLLKINEVANAEEKANKKSASEQNKVLKAVYKDSERDIKFSVEVTKLALDDLSVAYADNSISIAEYYKLKEELQLKNIANEKAIKEGELATATKGGDKAAMAKLQDEIKFLDITAQRIHPAITKDQSKDVLAFNNAVAQTNISYLELTGNTVAAAKAQEELNTAQRRKELDTTIKSGGPQAPAAKKELQQLDTSKNISAIKAQADATQTYKDKVDAVRTAYTTLGATSSDVLSASLGGYAPLFNLFDNFQQKQMDQQIGMENLIAKGKELAAIKLEIPVGDTAALEQSRKDIEINEQQKQILQKQTTDNQIKSITEAFAITEKAAAKDSSTQKIAHKAKVVMYGIEYGLKLANSALTLKASMIELATNAKEIAASVAKTAVKMAEGAATFFAQSGWLGFAGVAAMIALMAGLGYMASGGSTSVSNTSAPVSDGAGTVLGSPTEDSASLANALSLLTDINYKSYRELRKINDSLSNVMASIYNIALKNATNSMLVPDSGIPSVQALVNPTQLNSIEGLKKGILQQFNSMKSLGDIFSLKNLMPSFGNLTQMFKNLATLPQDLMKMVTKLVSKIPLVGGILAKFDIASKLDPLTGLFIKGIFGTVKRTIVDGGIQTMKQQAYTLLAGMNLSMAQYTTIEEVKKSWFKKSTKTFDVLSEASKEAVTSFTTMYRSIGTAVVNLAEGLSKAAVDAAYLYKFPPIKVSLRGQATDKIIAKMKAVISKQLDLMATKVFGDTFGGLQQLGEGMFQTVNRLYAERIIAKKSFESIGAAFPQGIEDGVKLADALVQVSSNADTAAGKLKDFAQQEADFFKNFASTITQNNLIVNDFIGSLKDIFTSGLSIDQINYTKNYVSSISTSVAGLNVAQRNYDLSLIKSKALIKAETAYANKPTIANKAKLDVLEVPYQTKVAETTTALAIATAQHNTAQQVSLGSFESLQQIFVKTIRTTGSFSEAVIAMRRNLDVTTDSGKKTYAMITQLDNAFTKLVDDVIKPITDQITTIADSIDTRTKETLLSQLEASRDYTTQKTLTTKIQKLITDKYNTEKTSITTIKNAFITLAQTVKDLLLGDLSTFNPFEKFQEAQKQYTDLLTLSQSNDVTIAADAASKLGAAAQKYLGEAKSYYGSTATYADIFNQVVATLTAMSTSNITQGTNATDMINALGAAAIVELQGLATTTTNAILATLEEGVAKLDITETTRSASDELATLASSAVSLGTTFEALIVKFNTVMGTVPEGQTSNMQTLTAKLAQAIASKDTKGATAIKAQISSYAKGFNKGGVPLAELYATNRTTLQTNAAKIAENQLKIKDKTLSAAAKKILQDEIIALKASTANITKIGAFADGGIASGLSLVGERGPELIQLPNSTRVTNNTSTNRILADSNKETLNVLTDMKKELIILNNRMEVIERKTRLSKSTMSMA